MDTAMRFLGATWELALVGGAILVLVVAVFVLVKVSTRGEGIWSGIKKALGIVFRNLL
jgi:hypothetical protein